MNREDAALFDDLSDSEEEVEEDEEDSASDDENANNERRRERRSFFFRLVEKLGMTYLKKIDKYVKNTHGSSSSKAKEKATLKLRSVINSFFRFLWASGVIRDSTGINESTFLQLMSNAELIINWINAHNEDNFTSASSVSSSSLCLSFVFVSRSFIG